MSVVILLLHQKRVQSIEALLPEHSIVVEPCAGPAHRPGFEMNRVDAAVLDAPDEARALERLDVLGDRGPGHAERPCELAHGCGAARQPFQDRAARRVGKSREGVVQPRRILNH
jgi:hypothetical protein